MRTRRKPWNPRRVGSGRGGRGARREVPRGSRTRRGKNASESRRCHPGFGQGAASGRWQPAGQISFFLSTCRCSTPKTHRKHSEPPRNGGEKRCLSLWLRGNEARRISLPCCISCVFFSGNRRFSRGFGLLKNRYFFGDEDNIFARFVEIDARVFLEGTLTSRRIFQSTGPGTRVSTPTGANSSGPDKTGAQVFSGYNRAFPYTTQRI